ncbi:MAG: ribosomal-protein-alanine N-acetyltransferase [Candidatus Abyssobacteria bacterium SURF_5]|uniref:Ribosomal-protein-alanine N-acetyltransferase n=1 Tax=Abyssobacteria bacterium (strain SURF_5) TaxID=2093360 RepID=A0A3A4NCU9_ABYX5|nr:MAG: ribosomal-protein-alanine N-acetyltransferase [Candidatus Abyssubacteria bacterium SURF_5]
MAKVGKLSFHTLSIKHLDEVLEIEKVSFRTPWTKYAFIHEIQFEKSVFKVLKLNGRIIGYGGFWHILDEAHISNIAIHPEYRGQGFGKMLLLHLLEEALQKGASKATLEVRRSNVIAQKMYSRFGFKIISVRKNYYTDEQEDALIMWNDDIRATLAAAGTEKEDTPSESIH